MKTIKIKKLSIELPGGKSTDTRDLIKSCLDRTPERGFTHDDLRQRRRIEDACDKANGEVHLEDHDAQNLVRIVKDMRWALRHPEIEEFCELIINMK